MTANGHRTWGAPQDPEAEPKSSLILAGGGIRLSYAAGAIKALAEEGFTFHHMDGTSGGGINLAMILSGLHPDEICERWRTLNMADTIAFLPLRETLDLPDFKAAASPDGFRNKALPHLGVDMENLRSAEGLQATFNMCNFSRKINQVFPHQDMDMDLLIAGMSLPGVFPPLERDNQVFMDSGFLQDANLLECVDRQSEELWLIWILGNTPEYRGGLVNLYVQALEASANGALHKEFAQIADINRRIEKGETVEGHTRPIRLHMIKPEYPLPLDTDLYLCRVTHKTLIEMGYSDARHYLKNRTPEGVPLNPDSTVMKTPEPGLCFMETMAGGFSLGETDPGRGAKKGKSTRLSMNVRVDIHDMEKFVADPNHQGRIIGSIDFAPFGNNLLVYNGVFKLFSPSEDPETKLMVYEMAFVHDNRKWFLAGRKEVRNDPGFDLWKDTTTLFTTLHEGEDKNGPIAGAGILSLDMKELIKLVKNIQVHGVEGPKQKLMVLGRFGKLFLGELWDTYAKYV